ncbi:hypothetical protein EI94DRAFT_1702283 [Lactarius quietus]|nr:hypothetical protein EI94DRAFT_1702283 [Lactarius quietus]
MDERSARPIDPEDRVIGGLFSSEMWWRIIIAISGPMATDFGLGKDFFMTEDGQPTLLRAGMDATRIIDRKPVMLKKVLPEEGPHELSIARYFSSNELRDDSRNHCVPLLDLIDTANTKLDKKLMVMPFLRPFNHPRFQTFGEFVAFFMQICEGLQFMHQRNVAHRDCTVNNIMFDPSKMYPNGYRSRNVVDEPLRGGDRTAPEHGRGGRCNPFPTDIYYIGNLVREQFLMVGLTYLHLFTGTDRPLQKCNGFEFMQELVDAMTDESPEQRPTIEEVIERFDRIRDSLSSIKLRSFISEGCYSNSLTWRTT